MPNKYVDFVSDKCFLECVRMVCNVYQKESKSADLEQMQKNALDPFKMVFDMFAKNMNLKEWIENESARQKDKTINNSIGEFHQKLLGCVTGWEDLKTGHELGMDLRKTDNSVFVELKNKHNTTKGDNLKDVYKKLENVIAAYPHAVAYYAYVIPKNGKGDEMMWRIKGKENRQIRIISGPKLYEMITGKSDALLQVSKALPHAINDLLNSDHRITKSDDKTMNEIMTDTFFKEN